MRGEKGWVQNMDRPFEMAGYGCDDMGMKNALDDIRRSSLDHESENNRDLVKHSCNESGRRRMPWIKN